MPIRYEIMASVVVATIDNPGRLNALDIESFHEIEQIVQLVTENPRLRAIIFTGAGTKAFSAGVDINEFCERDAAELAVEASTRRRTLERLYNAPVPSIAAIDGFALGCGLELALACTLRIGSPNAMFGFPEIMLALCPGSGGTQRLPRLVGASRALDMMLSGRRLNAREAVGIGLVNSVAENPLTEARCVADLWVSYSRDAIREILEAVRGPQIEVAKGLDEEGAHLSRLLNSRDWVEGVTAFLDKRKPLFNA